LLETLATQQTLYFLRVPSVLALLYVTKEFVFECDAFSLEIKAVLMQGNRPVAYELFQHGTLIRNPIQLDGQT
jgi:hypothetical protein